MENSRDVKVGWDIELLRYRLAIFFALADTFGEKILNLPIHRTEIVFRPSCNGRIQAGRQPQWDLLFLLGCHISTGCRNLLPAVRHGFRTERPADWKPWQLCAPHPALRPDSLPDAPKPFLPCQQRRLQSSYGRR